MDSGAMKSNKENDSHSSIQVELESFVKDITEAYQSLHKVTILDHELENKSMVECGRNLASGVLRLRLKFKKNEEKCETSVVMKVPHLSPSYAYFKELRLYDKELYMYRTVLPSMYNFWPHESMSPTFYGTSETGILALENLEEFGFCLRQKDLSLDLADCKAVLETVGKFHALSHKYLQTHGSEEFDSVMNFSGGHAGLPENLLPRVFEKIEKYVIPSIPEDYRKTWSEFQNNYMAALAIAYNAHSIGGIQVILHGDLQNNNLLWNKNNKCKLIDFQISRRGPPSLDIIYFLLSSIKSGLFQQHREALFKHYLGVLNGVLEELGCNERYTLAELNKDFAEYRTYSIFILSLIVPVLWSGAGNYSFESLAEDSPSKFDDIVQSTEYISFFKSWMDLL